MSGLQACVPAFGSLQLPLAGAPPASRGSAPFVVVTLLEDILVKMLLPPFLPTLHNHQNKEHPVVEVHLPWLPGGRSVLAWLDHSCDGGTGLLGVLRGLASLLVFMSPPGGPTQESFSDLLPDFYVFPL